MSVKKFNFDTKPFLPFVSIDQAVAFDKEKPETYTQSPLMNAFLEAAGVVGLGSPYKVAAHLELPSRLLWGAIEIMTGMKEYDFRKAFVSRKARIMAKEHPEWNTDMLAKELKCSGRAALYQLISRADYDFRISSNKTKPTRYYKNRATDEGEKESGEAK